MLTLCNSPIDKRQALLIRLYGSVRLGYRPTRMLVIASGIENGAHTPNPVRCFGTLMSMIPKPTLAAQSM